VSIYAGRNGCGTSHSGLLMPHITSLSQRVAEEMAAASICAAKFVAPLAARFGADFLSSPSSTAHRHRASVPSSPSPLTSSMVGETSCSPPTLGPNQEHVRALLVHRCMSGYPRASSCSRYNARICSNWFDCITLTFFPKVGR
jgi:hypothetical protein